jgi:hypothetical protein
MARLHRTRKPEKDSKEPAKYAAYYSYNRLYRSFWSSSLYASKCCSLNFFMTGPGELNEEVGSE